MAKWSKEALENFRKLRKEKAWRGGPKPYSEQQRKEKGLDEGNWKQRNPERHAEHRRAYSKRHPEKIAAQNAVIYALRTGRTADGIPFSRGPCALCASKGKTEAHHASYDYEKRYEVVWLCKSCHSKVSKENGQVKKCDFTRRRSIKQSDA